jgi:heavy metal translocating P-type ATPase
MKLEIIQPAAADERPAALRPCCAAAAPGELGWRCPMHPEVTSASPGTCSVCGMPLEPIGQSAAAVSARSRDLTRLAVCGPLAVVLMVVAMAGMAGHMLPHGLVPWLSPPGLGAAAGNWLQLCLATPIVFWGGWPMLVGGVAGFRRGRPTMFSLIALGVLVAWAVSAVATVAPQIFPAGFRRTDGSVEVFFESAGMIVVLVLVGQLLESRARRNTSAAIRGLMDLSPPTAERLAALTDATAETLPLAAVRAGDLLRVRPGGRIPTDGLIRAGTTACDESLLTGEPMPVPRTVGDPVLGGSLNGSGAIVVEATTPASGGLVARITRLVREAHERRAPIETLADRIAAVFVPLVLVAALLTFLGWAQFGPEPRLARGLLAAVSVLVIACPCGLGLATPLAMTVAIGRGARAGILARTAEAVERLAAAEVVVFDKTGTVTQGQPRVLACGTVDGPTTGWDVSSRGWDDEPARTLLDLAASVEASSEHGLAAAFTQAAAAAALSLSAAENVTAVVGRGVLGTVRGQLVLVGNGSFLRDRGIDVTPLDGISAAVAETGSTLVAVAVDGRLAGWFSLADPPRVEAAAAVAELHRLGIETELLSGDTDAAARHVAGLVGITRAAGALTPADKDLRVRRRRAELADRHGALAFVGDGVNDAPALAAADVGIAMGSAAAVALETADVTLLSGGLAAVPRAVRLARTTMRIVRQNLLLAFLYNVLAIPAAAGLLTPLAGHVTSPMLAAAAMTLSSLSVIANSLRLRRCPLD